MFSVVVEILSHIERVSAVAHKAALDNLSHALAGIRKDARASIQRSKKASTAGTPPHTRRGQIRNAIIYAVDRDSLTGVVGPQAPRAGTSGSAHEFGGEYKGQHYPPRPFMRPAMLGRLSQFAGSFAGSIGE